MRTVSLTQGSSDLTSIPSCDNRHAYSEHALGNRNGHKKQRDGDVFHRHGVHPARVFSGVKSGPLNDERDY